MTGRWRPTPALARVVVTSAVAVVAAVVAGTPVVMVLGAPFVLAASLALMSRPDSQPELSAQLDHRWLHEGQGTTSRLRVRGGEDVEHVARAVAPSPYVALHPASGLAAGLVDDPPVVEIGPRRWGRRVLGEEIVALTTPWAGYRWGPVPLHGDQLRVLPADPAVHLPRGDPATGRAGRRQPVAPARSRDRVRRHPAVPPRRPAAPDQLAGLGAQPRAARHHVPGGGGQRRAARRRRARRPRPLRRARR